MTLEILIFAAVATIAIGGALTMVLAKSAVHCALFLVTVQIALAIAFVAQGAFLVAALQVIVYAGAIMVLFVFVVMLLGVDRREALVEPLPMQRPLALGLGAALLVLGLTIAASGLSSVPVAGNIALKGEGNVEAVARVLFTKWSFAFEFTSVLLAVAVVGAITLAKREHSH